MTSLFSKIASGEIPSWKLAEDDYFFAFLDIQPLAEGHALVVPKNEVDYIFDMDADALRDFFAFAQQLAKAMKLVIPCKRIGVAVIGLEVPHAHIHLVPLNSLGDLDFGKPKLKLSDERMKELSEQIAQAFNGLFP
jgi:histidine triad (HIT) family protein